MYINYDLKTVHTILQFSQISLQETCLRGCLNNTDNQSSSNNQTEGKLESSALPTDLMTLSLS